MYAPIFMIKLFRIRFTKLVLNVYLRDIEVEDHAKTKENNILSRLWLQSTKENNVQIEALICDYYIDLILNMQ